MPIPRLHESQVLGALKATGSTDRDVLFARKEELLRDSNRMRMLGIVPIVVGAVMTVSVIGAIVGLPMLAFGLWVRSRIRGNVRTAERGLERYLADADPAHAVFGATVAAR